MGERGIFLGAKDQSDGWILVGPRPVLTGVIEIEVHLARVSMSKLAKFEIDDHQAAEPAVEEKEIHTIPFGADTQASLAADEGEIAAQFEQEGLQVLNQGLLKLGLGIFILQPQEFEYERILDFFLRSDPVLGLGPATLLEHGGLVAREGSAFIEERRDLAVQLPNRPPATQGFGLIEQARLGIVHGKQADVVRPGEREAGREGRHVGFCRQCLRNYLGCRKARHCLTFSGGWQLARRRLVFLAQRKGHVELAELLEVSETKPTSEPRCQIGGTSPA